ncbi:molybdenum cofactor sulfurase isoform X3 [Dunckerocampus dactyliophorus]|uniref:molybdenum cofactor sulfurase isoform X3 n=1 Tax=Dunckerocampus dactyliophorus TaxID=161453 RepID=UPI002406ED16|nr:molybdenum cofactor sulfurase isoform X3 [Dunckerocampus dactyliophorus]
MDFHKLNSFETFREVWSHYGYGENLEELRQREFARIKGTVYLDHAATTLYPQSLVTDYCQDMSRSVYGNPHSHNLSSRLTHDTVERVRYRILQHFNTTPEDYSVIFTSGCTAALKLVAEGFPWRPQTESEAGSHFCYLTDNHTSVVGIRGLTSDWGVVILPVYPQEVENRGKDKAQGLGALLVRNHAAGILKKTYFGGGTAAAYLSGEDFYVQAANVSDRFEDGTVSFLDIVALNHSFETLYRITGCMLNIEQHTFGLARYTYMLLSSLCHGNRRPVAQMYTQGQFESPSTQGAILNFNLMDSHGKIIGYSQVDRMASLYNIHVRTGCFCNTGACQSFLGITNQQMRRNLQAGHVCGDTIDLVDGQPTGSVRVSFGYMSTFDDCQKFLSFVAECFVEKPVTMDQARLERLKAAGASNEETTVNITEVTHKDQEKKEITESSQSGFEFICPDSHEGAYTLTNIYIYPIKSCGAVEVHNWPVGPLGLLYDRGWMVVNVNGVCLSQKRELRLCLIRPQVHLSSNELLLQASGMDTISVPLEIRTGVDASYPVCQTKVCGDRVETVDCGDEAASWLSDFLGQPCRLIRQSPNFTRGMKKKSDTAITSPPLSLVNEAQYLMINRASVELIHKVMSSRQDNSELDTQNIISRFRANFVIAGVEPFEEDGWSHLIIGNIQFMVKGQCVRCQMVGIDQNTGSKTKEPLMSLSTHRRGKVTFGVYLTHHVPEGSTTAGVLCTGAPCFVKCTAKTGDLPKTSGGFLT